MNSGADGREDSGPAGSVLQAAHDATPAAREPTLVVGLGASAGGLDAFRSFFKTMPADSGMAFVLVQHLDPERASALAEIVGSSTTMPVSQARTGDALAPNHVFVIPPDSVMTLSGGVLKVSRGPSIAARRASVNAFLVSLAEDQGENAVGIVLAGFGNDGALGVEAIREHGGLTLAQAEFDHSPKTGMPQSAAAGGYVDHVLSVEKMPAALIDYWKYRTRTDGSKGPDGVRTDVGDNLSAICAVLNSRLGRDFSQYKPNTLMRRVQRRMQVLQSASVADYLEQLRQRATEPELLFREVLIRVTRFFRDPAAFQALADRLPAILAQSDDQGVRVWAPGCATGEEAYTLAILFKEAMAQADRPRKVQIFATDIDDEAIEIARAGLYPPSVAADLPAALLERYFAKDSDSYRVSKDIREMCLFSSHDLVKDPPFSRLSLISCRNLMIYFRPALQKRVVSMFHYGLRPGGILFLGSSEAVTSNIGLFAPLEKKHRLFERRSAPSQLADLAATPRAPARSKAASETREGEIDPRIAQIVSRYAPAFAVTDRRHRVQQLSGQVGKYIAPSDGAVSLNLTVLARAELRAPLRAALEQAAATRRRVTAEGIILEIDGRREAVTLAVEPIEGRKDPAGGGQFVIAFQDLGPVRFAEPGDSMAGEGSLEELAGARERLQTLAEELETSNEELQSSNEEYQSVNEELQSTNEELETSKEELQSINEELATLNAELAARNESLVDLTGDLTNLIDSTAIATLFLDQDLRIRRFTPAVLEIFRVREGDQGRPITDIVSRLNEDGLYRDAAQVLRTLIPVHREVGLATGERSFQMEIRPYRSVNNAIGGIVITFVDITDRERAERARSNLAAIIDSSDDGIIGHDLDGLITSWNSSAERMFGFTEAEALGQPTALIVPVGRREDEPELLERVRRGERVEHYETLRLRKDTSLIEVSQSLSPVRNSSGTIIGAARIVRDITARRQRDREKLLLLGELDHRVKNILATVSSIVTQTLLTADTPTSPPASRAGSRRWPGRTIC